MELKTNKEELYQDIFDLVNLFEVDIAITHEERINEGEINNSFDINFNDKSYHFAFTAKYDKKLGERELFSLRRKNLKVNLYDLLSKLTKKTLPWGSLTGIRPTKLARNLIESGQIKEYMAAETLEREYRVRKDKAKLVANILKNQKCIIRNDNLVDYYVNIPVCPSRCLYCSFISSELERVKNRLDEYLDAVIKEIDATKEIIAKKSLIVRNIYIGGGTPTVLNAQQLDKLLSALTFPVGEFTVECGRPDTITAEKLKVLKKHNVTRISINPQTFCEATLKRIGRKHKNKEVLEAYSLALEEGFKVNMDVIAGLPGEKLGIFKRTMQTLLDLAPEKITVHALSVKNGSLLRDSGTSLSNSEACKMMDYAEKLLSENGYKPYYMYRQKHQLGGLENVGYFRDDNVCVFNVDSMEETSSVIAVGANAMSKRVFSLENRIEREANVKFIEDYISRLDEMIARKQEFFK